MTDAPMTPERRSEIVERYGTAREAAGYGNCESAIRDSLNDIPDLLSQVVRLAAELERSVSDHEACIEIIHKSDDEHARLSAALDAERKVTAGMRAFIQGIVDDPITCSSRSPDYIDWAGAVKERALAALDSAKEPTT